MFILCTFNVVYIVTIETAVVTSEWRGDRNNSVVDAVRRPTEDVLMC